MPPDTPARRSGEVYVELTRMGNAVKATAIDPTSGQEASIIGPASAASGDLQQLAIRKLRRRLAGDAADEADTTKGGTPSHRPGIIV